MKRSAIISLAVVVSIALTVLCILLWLGTRQEVSGPVASAPIPQLMLPQTAEASTPIRFKQYTPGETPELDSLYRSYMKRIPAETDEPVVLVFARFDLNLDGTREVFVNFATPSSCDERGCELALYSNAPDGTWRKLEQWMVPAESAYILPLATEGWSALAFGPGTAGYGVWRMSKSGSYVLAGITERIPGIAQ